MARFTPNEYREDNEDDIYRPLPVGDYIFKVVRFEMKYSKANNPYFNVQLDVQGRPAGRGRPADEKYQGRIVWETFGSGENSIPFLARFLRACGVGDVEVDTDDVDSIARVCEGALLTARLGIETWQGTERNKIDRYHIPGEEQEQGGYNHQQGRYNQQGSGHAQQDGGYNQRGAPENRGGYGAMPHPQMPTQGHNDDRGDDGLFDSDIPF